jgi:hypothetical protein
METLDLIQALNEATKILKQANRECAGDSLAIWRLTDHAEQHIDKQIRELLAPSVEIDPCILT